MTAPLRGSLVDQAVRSVRDYIREQDLKVGDTLPGEGQFATTMGVSRAVIREAFGALAALKLIDVGNGRKARVGAIDGSVMATSIDHAVTTAQISTADVWDVRCTLELRTAGLAAANRSDEDASAILAAAEGMARSDGDLNLLIHHDIAFHQGIARASGNVLFFQIIRSFEQLMQIAVPIAWDTRETADQRSAMLDIHRALAVAIADRAPGEARNLMSAHFDKSISAFLER